MLPNSVYRLFLERRTQDEHVLHDQRLSSACFSFCELRHLISHPIHRCIDSLCGSGLRVRSAPRTRRYGVIAIVVMHLFLLAVLSPLALGWNSVVPWNAVMIVLVPLLSELSGFRKRTVRSQPDVLDSSSDSTGAESCGNLGHQSVVRALFRESDHRLCCSSPDAKRN